MRLINSDIEQHDDLFLEALSVSASMQPFRNSIRRASRMSFAAVEPLSPYCRSHGLWHCNTAPADSGATLARRAQTLNAPQLLILLLLYHAAFDINHTSATALIRAFGQSIETRLLGI